MSVCAIAVCREYVYEEIKNASMFSVCLRVITLCNSSAYCSVSFPRVFWCSQCSVINEIYTNINTRLQSQFGNSKISSSTCARVMIVQRIDNDCTQLSSLSQLLYASSTTPRSAIHLAQTAALTPPALPNSLSDSFVDYILATAANAVVVLPLQLKALLIPKRNIRTRVCPTLRVPRAASGTSPQSSLQTSAVSHSICASVPLLTSLRTGPKCPTPRLSLSARDPARPRPHHPSPIIRLGPRRPRKRACCYTVAV